MDLPSAFDFKSYLHSLTGVRWEIEELSGGNANYTVRAVQEYVSGPRPVDDGFGELGSCLRQYPTLVLKQAPPFFAKFPDMKFSQYRQVVEAQTLRLMHSPSDSNPFGLAGVLEANPNIVVPRLLHHDASANVLVQSDLGRLLTLDQLLCLPSTTTHMASLAGGSLGRFLAQLHCVYDSLPSAFSDDRLVRAFANEDSEIVMRQVIVNAMDYMKDAGISDYEMLGHKATQNWTHRKKTVFGQGDIWYGTVLVDVSLCSQESNVVPIIGVCDWEFAGPNHPAGDIAQFGAYLHLSYMSTITEPSQRAVVLAFANAFYSSYLTDYGPVLLRADDLLMSDFQRSLVIMHGWELVNAAAWRRHLWCHCPRTEVPCAHITTMIEEGARVLRAADPQEGDHVDWEMLRNTHWWQLFELIRSMPLKCY